MILFQSTVIGVIRYLLPILSVFLLGGSVFGQEVEVDVHSVSSYILSHQKSNSAFGPLSMDYTDLAWTYPAVHALQLLDKELDDKAIIYQNGSKPWIEIANWKNGPWYWSLHQKANLFHLLSMEGEFDRDFIPENMPIEYKARRNYTEFKKYPEGQYFSVASLWNLVEAIYLFNGSVKNKNSATDFIIDRQTASGGFEDLLGNGTIPDDAKAHIVVTHDAIMALQVLGNPVPNIADCIAWIQSCQKPDGGFGWHPSNESFSNKSDVWYTWAAVKALDALNAKPKRPNACLNWLNDLQNDDGGFGDRLGWQSRLYSTYYAVHAIDVLSGNLTEGITKKRRKKSNDFDIPEGAYSIFQAHHKSPTGGEEMVDSIVAMGLNLIAIKTTEKEVLAGRGTSEVVANARKYAHQKGYSIEILDSPENYKHKLKWFSGMPGNHVSNFIIPPKPYNKVIETYLSAYSKGLDSLDWDEFKVEVIKPMLEMGTLFYPELDYNMENAYLVYDDGLDGNPGYNAVPGAHFGNYDWMRHFPYKEKWIGQHPIIADGDAHGDIHKWRHHLDSFRNVYLAPNNSYENYIEASLNGRSVCVIRLPDEEVRYYGKESTIAYLKERENEWKWW